jgi:hypothetical protein
MLPIARRRSKNAYRGLAVNRDGILAVAWMDGRSSPGHRCEQSLFLTASIDGGQSFVPAVRVSSTPRCDDQTRVGSSTGGDYFGLAPASDGSFRLLWAEMHDGVKQLVTTIVRVDRRTRRGGPLINIK